MPGLRVQSDVIPAAGDVHVDVFEQLGHLRDENLPPPLRLNEVERARESSARPPREPGHACRTSRIATAPAAGAPAPEAPAAAGSPAAAAAPPPRPAPPPRCGSGNVARSTPSSFA